MYLPGTVTLRIEPLGGLCGAPGNLGRSMCPICGEPVHFDLEAGTGHCELCGAMFTCTEEIQGEGQWESRVFVLSIDYSYFSMYRMKHHEAFKLIDYAG